MVGLRAMGAREFGRMHCFSMIHGFLSLRFLVGSVGRVMEERTERKQEGRKEG